MYDGYGEEKTKGKMPLIGGGIILVIIAIIIGNMFIKGNENRKENAKLQSESVQKLIEKAGIEPKEAVKVKGSIDVSEVSLFDEMPDINKYPLSVEGTGDADIEIFSSGEKAEKDPEKYTDRWLVETAEKFNKSGFTTSGGKSVSISVRSVSSGLGSDYIASGKYIPDLYTPSNSLFGDYCISRGGNLTLYNERLVGNTAGILVTKGSGYKDVKSVIDAVIAGTINIGYTNAQTSATGMNLLNKILKMYGGDDMFSEEAVSKFSKFNENIPFVAYTTQQMRDKANNGSLDAMVTEYQAYVNDPSLTKLYDFIPFGVRHDNPLYVCNGSGSSPEKEEAIKMVNDYLMDKESQDLATKYGFNANDDYEDDYEVEAVDIKKALEVYKSNKDSGKDIIAVFVVDCSGSMAGEGIEGARKALTNGANYINSNNYIGLITYSDDVTIELPIAKFDIEQRAYFQGAVNRMTDQALTATYDALLVAVDMVETERAKNPDAKAMIILLSDGQPQKGYTLDNVTGAIRKSGIPIHTISYTKEADKDEMKAVSKINEAATIDADPDDIVYQIKTLFNSQI